MPLFRASAKSKSIFVCYRHSDSADTVDRIYASLQKEFGEKALFRDVDTLEIGDKFRDHFKTALETCVAALVVIGPGWLEAHHENEQERRLDDPRDSVRLEIETALSMAKIRIVPVLIRNASTPKREQLPDSIQELFERKGVNIRPNPDFENDVARLIKSLRKVIEESRQKQAERPVPSSAPDIDETDPQPPPKCAWRAELVSKGWSQRTIRISLTDETRLIEFLLTAAPIGPQIIRVDNAVVAKVGTALVWQEKIRFPLYDGDVKYTAVIEAKSPIFPLKLRTFRLLVAGRPLYIE